MSGDDTHTTMLQTPAADARIRDRIEELVREQLDCGDVSVAVEQGHVTLMGTVTKLHEKNAIANIASQVEDVRGVENRISVRGTC